MKENVFYHYKKNLATLNGVHFQKIESGTTHSNWMLGIRIEKLTEEKKKELELFFFESGIDIRPMFYDIKKHDYLSKIHCEVKNSQELQKKSLILPSFPELTKNQVEYICTKLQKFFSKNNL